MSRLGQGRPASEGAEPDYRFTLANERTFLAWMRTSLGLLAGGLAVEQFVVGVGPAAVMHAVALLAAALGLVLAIAGWRHWSRVQHAMRAGVALPASWSIPVLAVGLALIAGLVFVSLLLRMGGS